MGTMSYPTTNQYSEPMWSGSTVATWNTVAPTVSTTTPTQTFSNPFSTSDMLNQRYQSYSNLWDTNLANQYKTLWNENNAYSNVAKQTADFYDLLAQDVAWRSQNEINLWTNLANQLNADLLQSRDYALSMFGPQWTLTNEINQYYDDLGNYLASDAWRQEALIDAEWVHSWASLWALRAQRSQAYNESFNRYIQAKEKEIEAKTNIANNLLNYMSQLRQEYGNTNNQYIIAMYQRANDLLNNINTSLASSQQQIANAQLAAKTAGSGSSWSNLNGISNMDLYKELLKQQAWTWTWTGTSTTQDVSTQGWVNSSTPSNTISNSLRKAASNISDSNSTAWKWIDKIIDASYKYNPVTWPLVWLYDTYNKRKNNNK